MDEESEDKDEENDSEDYEKIIKYTATRKGDQIHYSKAIDLAAAPADDEFAPLSPELQTANFGVKFVNNKRFALNDWEIREAT